MRNVVRNYTYDDIDTLTQVTTGNNIEKYEYNDYGAISMITYSGEVTRTVNYIYESTSKMRLINFYNGAHFIEYGYDSLGRNNKKIIVVNNVEVCKQTIAYTAGLNCTTTMPSKITYNDGSSIAYTYDELGNIKKITANNKSIDYTYDKFGRLIREDNQELDKSYIYSYDNNGNITKKETYDYTKAVAPSGTATVINYTYNGNKLISFGGESCLYDSIGNPTLYRGNSMTWALGGINATWKGRQLQSYNNVTFGYDGLGRRMSKTVSGTKTEYSYDSEDKLLKSSDGMEYFYDETGVISFKYNGVLYIYKKDIQGNINAILDNNGNVVVEYKYDAWGNHTVSGSNITLGNLNPFRYRGYFYDTETGLYYLKTRYYDPEVGRFLNMDSVDYADPEATDGLNLYVYCGNNPVMGYDPSGTWNWDKFWQGLSMLATAVTAITLAVTTFGAGIPLAMTIVAGVTAFAGTLTGINGIATIVEAGTDYNFVRDGMFQGNETAYNWYAGITETVATIGSLVLEIYHTTGQYKAAKYGQDFLGKGYKKVGHNRWVSSDGMRQMRWDTTHHLLDGVSSANHFNLYTFQNNYWLGGRNPITSDIHLILKWFSFIIR